MNKAIANELPKLYSTEHADDPIVKCKFFLPWNGWTWYATEFDSKDTFFGYVVGIYPEWGYFSLSELESIRGPWGLGAERDLYFRPKPFSEVLKEIEGSK